MSQERLKHRIYSYICGTPSEFTKEDVRFGTGCDKMDKRVFYSVLDNVLQMLYRNNELSYYNGMYQVT